MRDAAKGIFLAALSASAALLLAMTAGDAGHELPVYPSYYPQEIRIEPMPPDAAARRLIEGKLHAHVGAAPDFAGAAPATIRSVATLRSLVVLAIDGSAPDACPLRNAMARALAGGGDGFVYHPYPVTPLHGEYLYHADRAASAGQAIAAGEGAAPAGLVVGAAGEVAKRLVRAHWSEATSGDTRLEEVAVAPRGAAPVLGLNGWQPAPWTRDAWHLAHRALADGLDAPARSEAEALAVRLIEGEFASLEERFNLERALLALLTSTCARTVVGYAVRREFYSDDFTFGVENIAFDAQEGLNAEIFVRNVKLKDLPWNGWLSLGVGAAPKAAWNPVAGFTDGAGRLIWAAVGDPAYFAEPYDRGFSVNRIGGVQFGGKGP